MSLRSFLSCPCFGCRWKKITRKSRKKCSSWSADRQSPRLVHRCLLVYIQVKWIKIEMYRIGSFIRFIQNIRLLTYFFTCSKYCSNNTEPTAWMCKKKKINSIFLNTRACLLSRKKSVDIYACRMSAKKTRVCKSFSNRSEGQLIDLF